MFENVGQKIKTFAVWFFAAEAIAAIITGIALGVDNGDAEGFWLFLLVAVGGIAVALITAWFLFGFGEIVEMSEKSMRAETNNITPRPTQVGKVKQYVCDNCGRISTSKGNCSICGCETRQK